MGVGLRLGGYLVGDSIFPFIINLNFIVLSFSKQTTKLNNSSSILLVLTNQLLIELVVSFKIIPKTLLQFTLNHLL